jgi:hypothetical protein
MRLIALALIFVVASSAHAANGLLQTIEHHTQPIAAPPTTKRIGISQVAGTAASYIWAVDYADTDLGVTTWSASAADVEGFNRVFIRPPTHGSHQFTLRVGEAFPNRSWFQGNGTFPVVETGTQTSFGDDSTATFTLHVLQGYYAPVITGIEMELSPWVNGPQGWTATQTIRVYGPVPEPATWALLASCAPLVRLMRRRTAGQ